MRNDQHRNAVITGLRALADFLTANPAVPVPRGGVRVAYFPNREADAEMCAEIDAIAALLGVPINSARLDSGHYATGRDFGPVRYEAVAILANARARHEALMSYSDNVTPEPGADCTAGTSARAA
ncbi:hypothetical protein [Sphaerimonospora mesophila]|uniref:hypothetical protein n=1 Tax=Sphaerimonospora mesophila TaxID=37483 RepID=UPI0006E2AC02